MRTSVLFGMLLAMGAIGGLAQAKDFTGEIMDSSCAKTGSHAAMEAEHKMGHDAKVCTEACVKSGGAKYVLYMNKKAYELDDQTKPEAFAGQKVKVSGTMDAKTNTIKVDSIAPAS
jgi:hypothetical protein